MAEKDKAPLPPELQSIANQAAAVDAVASDAVAAVGAEQGAAVEAATPSQAEEVAALLSIVVAVLSPMLPYLPGIYTQRVVESIAAAYVPVAEKYGWQSSGMFAKWGPEIGLALVLLQPLQQTVVAHKALIEQRLKEAEEARAEAHRIDNHEKIAA